MNVTKKIFIFNNTIYNIHKLFLSNTHSTLTMTNIITVSIKL